MDRPRVVGRYALYDELGVGGMGSVRIGIARDGMTLSVVAAKELLPSEDDDPRRLAMLMDETRLTRLVQHPNVVGVRDFVHDGSRTLLVMDYVHGVSLRKLLVASRDAPVPVPIAASIARDVLRALDAAHQARDERGAVLDLVHRDVSPENILVDATGAVRLADFGLAKAQGRIASSRSDGIKGKLAYIAPEQVGGEVTARTDIYATGLVLWETIVGRRAFIGENEAHLLMQVLTPDIPRLGDVAPHAPAALEPVLARMLAPAASERFATARDAVDTLESAIGSDFAPPLAIAEWVAALAGDTLEVRRRRLDEIFAIERDASGPPDPSVAAPSSATNPPARSEVGPAMVSAIAPPHPIAPWRVIAGAALLAITAWAVTAWVVSAGLAGKHAKTDAIEDPAAPAQTEPLADTPPSSSAPTAELAASASVPSASEAVDTNAPSPAAAPKKRAAVPPRPSAGEGARVRRGRASCDPPFTVDAKGIVVYNNDCLR